MLSTLSTAGYIVITMLLEILLHSNRHAAPTAFSRGVDHRHRLQVVLNIRLHRLTAIQPAHKLLDQLGVRPFRLL